MKKVKRVAKAVFHREMYPGVRFCERCFCHHNMTECPTYGKEPQEPMWEQVDMLGTWKKITRYDVSAYPREANHARDL